MLLPAEEVMSSTERTTPSTALSLWFVGPRRAELRDATVPPPTTGQMTIRARVSLVSAGTEMLIYRG